MPNVIMCTFGDMIRVPGSNNDLQSLKASGASIKIVYSPLECIELALENPDKEVVFLAVGFETTAPGNAMLVKLAHEKNVKNLSLLVSHVLVPPAIKSLLSSKENKIQGFLAAGHVCTIMGEQAYTDIVNEYNVPIVITGFEPIDILQGLLMCIRQLENGEAKLENQYVRSVHQKGNIHAQRLIEEIFQVKSNNWRGIGSIENSGLELKEKYKEFDAENRFNIGTIDPIEPKECISGLILQGIKKPKDCKSFGTTCTPDNPIGAPMVSGEGACAAYYKYKRQA
jgi:hydrogenase expression/formation protein HypD